MRLWANSLEEREMHVPTTWYEDAYRSFEWNLPPTFNFGRDVVGIQLAARDFR